MQSSGAGAVPDKSTGGFSAHAKGTTMSSAGISFGGLGSGIDSQAIISALMAIERRPISALEQKKTQLGRQKTLFSDFGKLLDKLQDAAKKLKTTTDFLSMRAASSNEEVVTVSAGNGAIPGTHTLEVVSLAKAQIDVSSGSASQDDPIYDGTILINIGGNDHPVSVSNGSLQDLANAINDQDLDVRAEVVDTGSTGSDRYKLVLRSQVLGTEGSFSLLLDSGNVALDSLVTDLTTNARAATNASLVIDGVGVTRTTNTIGDLIPGVTLDLHSVSDIDVSTTISVSTDVEETAKSVQELVDAYNAVIDFAKAQNAVGENGTAQNPLFGDVTLRTIRTSLRDIVGGAVPASDPAFAMLAQIGVTSDRDGRLTLNRTKFEEAVTTDEQAVASLFSNATHGIGTRLFNRLDTFTHSVDGLLKARSDGFDRLIKDAQSRIDQGESRLERTEKALQQRYANLETVIARLQGQGAGLSSLQNLSR